MKRIIQACLSILLTLLSYSKSNPVRPSSINGVIVPQDLFYLGMVEGKHYFSESEVARTWNEAKIYCEEYQMNLATITTKAEADFLASIMDNSHFYGGFWTGGRDARTYRQFSWDKTGNQVEDVVPFLDSGYPIGTCLYYEGVHHNYYEPKPCTLAYKTLCEM